MLYYALSKALSYGPSVTIVIVGASGANCLGRSLGRALAPSSAD